MRQQLSHIWLVGLPVLVVGLTSGYRPAVADDDLGAFVAGAVVGYVLAGHDDGSRYYSYRERSGRSYCHRDSRRVRAAVRYSQRREHRRWHYRNDYRVDPWYGRDYAREHKYLRRERRNFRCDQRRGRDAYRYGYDW
jgi:hypothetical protein